MPITPVLLSLGANLGDRLATLHAAVQHIRANALLEGVQVSSLYETEPVGYTEQPAFLNCCVVGLCQIEAISLRRHLSALETALGRTPRARWHEREIDIDILLFGDTVIESEELILPHPRMHQRNFVLIPTAEIAPTMLHPLLQKTMAECLALSTDTSAVNYYGTL